MLVGIVQVGTFDQNKELYDRYAGLKRGTYPNVFAAAFTSGLLYSIISKIVMLSRFAALSVSLTQKVSLFQGRQVLGGRHAAPADDGEHDA